MPRPSSTSVAPWSTPVWIKASARARACLLIIGPTSASGSVPPVTTSPRALAAILGTISDAAPTKTAALMAMHLCPAAPKAAPVSAPTVDSSCASGKTTAWFFAPMLLCTRLPLAHPRSYTCLPAWSEPTKEMARMSGWSQIPFTTSRVPCTMFSTPAGSPASIASSPSIIDAPGSCSDGLRTKVLPAVHATGYIQSGTIAGKLKGQMPATTPSGSRIEYVSMPLDTFCTSSPC
mmetsp:Transcript_12875/g.32497  ORF Transcript_12875/g.32497 Transcript_12875/m.32497 type:complete len:234 (+) Transcript_12875:529-1230(+)